MKITDILIEGRNVPCIVVDVQPAYTNDIQWIPKLMAFLNNQSRILMFVNSDDSGLTLDSINDITDYWEDNGFDPDNWHNVEIVDKGYGYFRGWMDNSVSDKAIIAVIRQLYLEKESDSREIFGGNGSEHYNERMAELGIDENNLSDSIGVEWTSVKQLREYGGGYIMGGGKNQCLKEVQLLMNAFNIKYKVIGHFVYG